MPLPILERTLVAGARHFPTTFTEFIMTNFSFLRFFGNNSNNTSKKKAAKQRQGRTARIEELENREMLSVSPWVLADDLADTSQPSTHNTVVVNTSMPEGSPQATGASALAPASANAIVVSNTADSGAGSLRQAILDSQDGDTITFASSLHGQTITLNDGSLFINKDITLDATGADITIDANQKSRVITIDNGRDVVLKGLTITGGGGGFAVGGIYGLANSTITVMDSIISENTGIGIHGLANSTITVTDSIISENGGNGPHGGIFVAYDTTITVTNSTISGNTGYGIYSDFDGTITVTDSTISENTGSGINVGNNSTITVTDSTISENTGSGINVGNNSTITVTNSTIS